MVPRANLLTRLSILVAVVVVGSAGPVYPQSRSGADAAESVASKLARQSIGHGLTGGPGAVKFGYTICVDCDWLSLPAEAYVAYLLRGKDPARVDLYLDYASAQLESTLKVAGYWSTILDDWASMDEASRGSQRQAESNVTTVLQGITSNRQVAGQIASLRTALSSNPKYHRLIAIGQQVRQSILAELRAQPKLLARFSAQPAPSTELMQARKALAEAISK